MIKRVCDHCEKELKKVNSKGKFVVTIKSAEDLCDVNSLEFDICYNCEKELRDYIIKYFNVNKPEKLNEKQICYKICI